MPQAEIGQDEFLQLVYDRFREQSAWPKVRDLQVVLRPLNVKLLAAQIGMRFVVSEGTQDGICFLTLEGLARCPKANEDIDNFLSAVRFISDHYLAEGAGPVTAEMVGEELGLSPEALRRLGWILRNSSVPMTSGSWAQDGSHFTINPSDEAWAYEHVKTLADFIATRDRIGNEAIAASQARFESGDGPNHFGSPEPEKGDMKVFISWSGERSHKLAVILSEWLPLVIQSAKPFVSSEDLRKGSRWVIELGKELERSSFGILCIVPDNLGEPWLNFEAGALSKFLTESLVVPLLFGLQPSDLVGHPLHQFQAAVFERGEMLKTLRAVNDSLGKAALTDRHLERAFDNLWPKLAEEVDKVLQAQLGVQGSAAGRSGTQSVPDVQQRILAMWKDSRDDLRLDAEQVAQGVGISPQQARYHLDELTRIKFLHDLHGTGRPPRYMLKHAGRQFLVERMS